MKELMRILCLLICVVMCLGAVACATEQIDDPDAEINGETPLSSETDPIDPEDDKKDEEKGYSTYELTLMEGTTGAILVNDFDAEGRLLRTNIKGDVDDFGGLVTMYMDHTYSEEGVLLSSTVYFAELYSVFGPAWIYEKGGTINWTADDSGRIVSGMAQNSIDFWQQISITYHGNTKIPDTVVMSELGDPDTFYMVKYDENGKKISEQYETDVIFEYTYESSTLTKVEISSPQEESPYAGEHSVEYDEMGRIIKTVVPEEEEDDYTFSYTYAGESNTVKTCCIGWKKGEGRAEELEFAFEYGEDSILKSCVVNFKELRNGEIEGLSQDIYTLQRDDLGRVAQCTLQSIHDEVEYRKKITTVEYKDSLSFTASYTKYSLNDETNKLEETDSGIDLYKYDENGNRIEVIFERFNKNKEKTNESEYRYEYDSRGNRTLREETIYNEGEKSTSRHEYVYGDVPVLLKVTYCTYNNQDEREEKTTIEYEYNDDFVEIKQTETNYDKNDVITGRHIYEYNEKGKKISHLNVLYQNGEIRASYVTLYEYDNDGRSSRVEETRYSANGDVRDRVVREYEYDQYGVERKLTISHYGENLTLEEVEIIEKVMLDRNRMHTMTDSTYDGEGNLLEKKVKEHIYEGDMLIKVIDILYDGDNNEIERNETEF